MEAPKDETSPQLDQETSCSFIVLACIEEKPQEV